VTQEETNKPEAKKDSAPRKDAAERALAEAAARRRARESAPSPEKELQGRGGLDPVRYGDWEVKGIASDF